MKHETIKIAEYVKSEKAIVFVMGGNEYGLLYDDNRNRLEIWVDHAFNGNGCNNLILPAFGRDLDLEFCRSVNL